MYKQLQMANTVECNDADFTLYNSNGFVKGFSNDIVFKSGPVRTVGVTGRRGQSWSASFFFVGIWQQFCAGYHNSNTIHRKKNEL